MTNFHDATRHLITDENALAWYETPEKWIFCTDLLAEADIEYDPHGNVVERLVNSLERRLERQLTNRLEKALA